MNAPGAPSAGELPASWPAEVREALFAAVDESDYSLADWLEAIGAFCAWLESRAETRRPWLAMFDYIHCCTVAAPVGIALGNLKVIVHQALTEFGFRLLSESQD